MSRFRDQALLMQFLASLAGVLVAFNLGLTDETAALWLAAINAIMAAVTAAFVRPLSPTVFTGAFSALAALVGGYGFEIGPEKLSALNLVVVMGLTFFFVRPNSTPKLDPLAGQGVPVTEVSRIKGESIR